MFGKIKSKLSAVFSKTQDVIEEEQQIEDLKKDENSSNRETPIENKSNKNLNNNSNDISDDISSYNSNDEFKEQIKELDEEEKRLDRLESELEAEIDETSKEVQELESVDSEEIRNSQDVEIEHEQKDLDRLEEELEAEINETTKEVTELEHVASENSDFDKYNSYKSQKEFQDKSKTKPQDMKITDLEKKNNLQSEDENIEEEVLEQKVEEKRGGFFSGIFGRKKKVEEDKVEDIIKEEQDSQEKSIEEDGDEKSNTEKISTEKVLDKEPENKEDLEEDSKEDTKESGFLQSAFSSITQKKISQSDFDTLWAELELFLLEINIAYEIVEKIEREMKNQILGNKFSRFSLKGKIKEVLISEITQVMKSKEAHFDTILNEFLEEKTPVVIMMLGVNGTGKTTSIGKIIKHLQNLNKSVVVAAADTFRAAAVEQVEEHCNNLGVKCVKHKQGADPAAVCYDAIEHAKAKNVDVVLIDTAGRMPNNKNLMEELKKIKRVSKTDIVMFIGDSVSGNDLLEQIELFDKGLGISGVVLTKVDTDERPGSVVTTAYSIDAPIYFLGTGQRYEDLVQFDAKFVAEQLFDEEE